MADQFRNGFGKLKGTANDYCWNRKFKQNACCVNNQHNTSYILHFKQLQNRCWEPLQFVLCTVLTSWTVFSCLNRKIVTCLFYLYFELFNKPYINVDSTQHLNINVIFGKELDLIKNIQELLLLQMQNLTVFFTCCHINYLYIASVTAHGHINHNLFTNWYQANAHI